MLWEIGGGRDAKLIGCLQNIIGINDYGMERASECSSVCVCVCICVNVHVIGLSYV